MLKVNELFSGIGSQRVALERLGIEHEVVGIAEIDKYAIKSYEAIHGSTRNYGDISKIEKLDYADFWTYSFPCQDISVAGLQRGINEHTRSGLLYQVERLLQVSKDCGELPKYLMLENVKNLVGKKFKSQFDDWIKRLDELGYNTYWQVLNSKNYGIPQNRERVFAFSIRKDIDTGYEFPEPFELKIRLKDILEKEVDEKYYLSDSAIKRLVNKNQGYHSIVQKQTDATIASTLFASMDKPARGCNLIADNICVQQIGNIVDTGNWENPQRGRIYSPNGCSPALNCCGGGGLEPKILEPMIHKVLQLPGYEQGGRVYGIDGISATLNARDYKDAQKILEPCIAASRGRNPENPSDRTVGSPTEQRLEINQNGTSNTITTVQKDNYVIEPNVLTPKRTEYGKAIRKEYESGLVQESRHNMTEMQPREDGICNTLTTVQKDNYVVEPQIIKIEIPQTVTVRKYPIDSKLLCKCLQDYKFNSNLSNKEIASALDKPITLVEHWFRNDNCFAIPDADIWFELKKLLNITTDEFDLPITEFIEQDGVYEKANRCYMTNGISPTLTSTTADEKIIDNHRIRKLTPLECFRLMGFTDEQFYKAENVNSNSQLYRQAGNSIVVDVLYYLFKNLFIQKAESITNEIPRQMSIEEFI